MGRLDVGVVLTACDAFPGATDVVKVTDLRLAVLEGPFCGIPVRQLGKLLHLFRERGERLSPVGDALRDADNWSRVVADFSQLTQYLANIGRLR